jgi:hypothetical protein
MRTRIHGWRAGAATSMVVALAVGLTAVLNNNEPHAVAAPDQSGQVITGAAIGVPQTWATGLAGGQPNGANGPMTNGDTWYNTWADDGNIYATSDDSRGFAGTCTPASNIVINEITGADPSLLSSPFTNCMTSFGRAGHQQNYHDCVPCTWKTDGVLSVDGTLFVAVARQQDGQGGYPKGLQPSFDASIIKSTDHGRTWSNGFGTVKDPKGAAPPPRPTGHGARAMFPGSNFTTPQFINYGQDDNPAGAPDGGDQFVYAISNDGFAYDGSYMILGRVPRSRIGRLNGADWQYYTGSPGGAGTDSANWSSDVTKATHVVEAPHQLSQSGVQYISALHEYVMTSFYYPFVSSWNLTRAAKGGAPSESNWDFYQSPRPWGPWTRLFDKPTTVCYFSCDSSAGAQLGLYDPALVSKFIRMGGLSNVIFSSGDFNAAGHPNENMYHLQAFPFTLTTNRRIVDDTSAIPVGSSNWGASYGSGGYYDHTYHLSATPGTTISYTFDGTSIAWVGGRNNNHGIATVSVDGGQSASVDTYAGQWKKQQVLFTKAGLSAGNHTITITVTPNKNAASSGLLQDIDAFIVDD